MHFCARDKDALCISKKLKVNPFITTITHQIQRIGICGREATPNVNEPCATAIHGPGDVDKPPGNVNTLRVDCGVFAGAARMKAEAVQVEAQVSGALDQPYCLLVRVTTELRAQRDALGLAVQAEANNYSGVDKVIYLFRRINV